MSLVSLLLSLFPASAPAGKRLSLQLYLGLVIGFTLSLSSTSFALFYQSQRKRRAGRRAALSAGAAVNGDKRPVEMRAEEVVGGVAGLIGAHTLPHAELGQSRANPLMRRSTTCSSDWYAVNQATRRSSASIRLAMRSASRSSFVPPRSRAAWHARSRRLTLTPLPRLSNQGKAEVRRSR